MKKKLLFILSALGAIMLTSCSNGDENTGYSDAEREVLSVLNGTFVCADTTISFYPFGSPMPKKSTMNDVPINFDGKMTYNSTYYDNEFYFYIDITKRQIGAYATNSQKQDYFNAFAGKFYDYEIVDHNTIKLFDRSLSNPLFQTDTFVRKQ